MKKLRDYKINQNTFIFDDDERDWSEVFSFVQPTMLLPSINSEVSMTVNALVFDNPSFVDTGDSLFSESDNVQAALTSFGHLVSTTTAITGSGLASSLMGIDVFAVPELESGNWYPSSDTSDVIQEFVSLGGTLIKFGFSGDNAGFLNSVFGFSVVEGIASGNSFNQSVSSSPFASGPSSLPDANGTDGLLVTSLPTGSIIHFLAGSYATVVEVPYGNGTIIYLGYDWFRGAPRGDQDGGWLEILNISSTAFIGPLRLIADEFNTDELTTIFGNVFEDNGNGADFHLDALPISVASVEGVAVKVGVRFKLDSGAFITLRADGSFEYEPTAEALLAGESFVDTVTYIVTDGTVSRQTMLTVNVTGIDNNDVFTGTTADDLAFSGIEDDRLFGLAGDDRLLGQDGEDVIFGGSGEDILLGGNDSDLIYGNTGNDRLNGGEGDDNLLGGEGDDILRGETGDDVLLGGTGGDILRGGEGDDILRGGNGEDKLFGGVGDDILKGGADNDALLGGDGEDVLIGGSGNDYLDGGDNNDSLIGQGGDDILNGRDGDDVLFADAGADRLYGGSGNDGLFGGSGDDFLHGETGDDFLNGGTGDDTLVGGQGMDTFTFYRGGGHDTIADFNPDNEVIRIADFGERFDSFEEMMDIAVQSGTEVLFIFGNGDIIFVENTEISDFTADDFVFFG